MQVLGYSAKLRISTDSQTDFWNGKNFSVINHNEANINTKKLIPLLVPLSFSLKIKRKNQTEKYLNIIIDKAHYIISYDSQRESESWKDYRLETFEEIIKGGRKFGVFLTISSQRPSDVSTLYQFYRQDFTYWLDSWFI